MLEASGGGPPRRPSAKLFNEKKECQINRAKKYLINPNGKVEKRSQKFLKNSAALLVLALVLSGCGNPDWFQPPPTERQVWTKPGATSTLVSKALLECGSASISSLSVPPREDKTPNQQAQIQRCMFADGFTMTVPKSQWYYCEMSPNLPSCQTGSSVVQRSVSRRVQSEYCRRRSDLQFCLRTAVNKSACTQTERLVPAECLP